MPSDLNEHWIARTIELARQAKGKASPNPLVGAVVLNPAGELIAEGFHEKAGSDHAEVNALKKLGGTAPGGILYVNLEPCNHYGKTPPCTEAIIKAGIKKVIIGSLDPNDKVNGQGVKALQNAGLEVVYGVLEKQCLELNRFFFHWIKTKMPWVSLKIAATLNGKINIKPHNDWITGLEARKRVHEMRAEYDAVLTGSGTIIEDNPRLTVRMIAGRNPTRVILDRRLRCDKEHNVFHEDGNNILFTASLKNAQQKGIVFANTEIIEWNGELKEVLKLLGEKNYLSVMIEAGNLLNTSFIEEKLVNEILYFVNPSLIGRGSLTDVYSGDLAKFKLNSLEKLGEDCLLVMKA